MPPWCVPLPEMKMMLWRFLAAVVFASLCGSTATAQIAAELRGRVLDPSGSTVGNASIDLTQVATNTHISTVSSGSGDYSFTNLAPGVYQMDVAAPGFSHLRRAGIHAIVGQTVNVDLTLSIGGSQQTVEVTADAALLQSQTSNIQTNIAGPTVIAMP